MTDYELATLRLETWKALAGWGMITNPEEPDLLNKDYKPWSWEERMRRADELASWAVWNEKTSSV